ncbi:MAG: Pls/PosA family non-ribosomal peptide synthetase [Solirubrobacteraceae bacterium]
MSTSDIPAVTERTVGRPASRPRRPGGPAGRAHAPTDRTPPSRDEGTIIELTLLDLFEATVATWGERPAVDAPRGVLTYNDLSAEVQELAGRLRDGGVGPGDRVGVRVPSGKADLYVAILGALAAGAAYVPVDADDPDARAEQIFTDAGVCAVIGKALEVTWRGPAGGRPGRPTPDDDAWIIFTSGSTGKPKGVSVPHRAAAAFVRAEDDLWRVMPEDRVLAGLSVAFDASCEEMWLAWAHGACLVPAPRALVRSGVELGPWLKEHGITVISTVPTLAGIWDDDALSNVRLLILGGEACPEYLVERLAPGRELWNTYGPTEATVVATATRLYPGAPVTIGAPLRGWELAVVDPEGTLVPEGEPGELVISGVGLGHYLRPELDAERYRSLPAKGWKRAYRTGDIVRQSEHGLEFVGRRDHQVKIGGRRIELGEVDGVLNSVPGVHGACTVVRESTAGNKILVGYVAGDVDPQDVRAVAAERIPASLVPLIVVLDELPMATSGKVDRKALPWPPPGTEGTAGDEGSLTAAERKLAERWREQLGPVAIDGDSDFFALGGTSLAVAKLVSVLRTEHPAIAVADVYEHRTLRELTARLESVGAVATDAKPEFSFGAMRRLGLMQLVGVFVLFAIQSVPWLLAALAYGDIADIGTPHVGWLWLGAAWVLLASPPAHIALQCICTRVLLRDLRPGRYSRYSSLAARLWFVDRLAEVTRFNRLGGTPWADRYARLVGADVGEGARRATVPPAGSLLHIGTGATVESNVDLRGWWIDGQDLVVGEIRIGAGARVGSRALLNPGAIIGDGAEIEVGTVVSGEIPAGERWGGAPARQTGTAGDNWPAEPPAAGRARGWAWLFSASLVLELAIALAAIAPAVGVLAMLGSDLPTLHSSFVGILLEAAIFTAVFIPMTAILVALTLRLVWRFVKPGWYDEHSPVGWALWFAEELKQSSSTQLFPLYASLYTRPWFRMMGLKIGRGTEISVTTGLNPLVSFGELSQCTDDIGFCGVRSRDGWMAIEPIEIGDRSFLGPGSILRGGTRLDDDSLLGVMTLSPKRPAAGSSWLGVPALELPRVPDATDPSRTVNPPRRLKLARGVMDLLRLLVPNTIVLVIEAVEIMSLAAVGAHFGLVAAIVAAPFVLIGGALVATAVTVAMKWILIGHYRRSEHPLWCSFVWRDEMMNAAQEQLADERLLRLAMGTPIMSMYLRAMGSKIGRGVWCETTAVTEHDMIDLGDGTAVNRGGCLMTHLFHDRLLRIGPTRLDPGATLGPTAVVLPDTHLGAGTRVFGHSVVLRGEELPAGTRWHGTPVVAL